MIAGAVARDVLVLRVSVFAENSKGKKTSFAPQNIPHRSMASVCLKVINWFQYLDDIHRFSDNIYDVLQRLVRHRGFV